jgi:hypothetical protein
MVALFLVAAGINKTLSLLWRTNLAFIISKVSIVNQAFQELGADPIASFDEGSTNSILAKTVFDNARRRLLTEHTWSFATTQLQLAREVATPVFKFNFRYSLPADMLYLLEVEDGADFDLLENSLLTNLETVKVSYVKDEEDVSKWSASFVEAMVSYLRYKFAFAKTGSTSETERSYTIYLQQMKKARNLDSMQEPHRPFAQFDNALINSRNFGRGRVS